MIQNEKFDRAELFAAFAEKPILLIVDMLGDGVDQWFVANDILMANPSNHIHYHQLKNCKCITQLMSQSYQTFDKVMFNTKLMDIHVSSLQLAANVKWVLIG